MSWIGGLLGGAIGGASSQQQLQGQGAFTTPQGGAGQTLITDGTGNSYWAQQQYTGLSQQLGGLYNPGGTVYAPPITYEPIYPIAITHRATGRKLIIWED
jgi:hypothetical protein